MESCHFESQSVYPPCRPLILKSLAMPLSLAHAIMPLQCAATEYSLYNKVETLERERERNAKSGSNL